jgi:hypothetical protein
MMQKLGCSSKAKKQSDLIWNFMTQSNPKVSTIWKVTCIKSITLSICQTKALGVELPPPTYLQPYHPHVPVSIHKKTASYDAAATKQRRSNEARHRINEARHRSNEVGP